jgi:fibro-slime domain-containing protein
MKAKSAKTLSAAVAAAVFGVLGATGGANAQQTLPNTILIPVTFYDFHSDRSNPEFEQPHQGGLRQGMVGNTLDGDNKPVLGSSPMRNYGIAHWFRDWNAYTAGPYSKGKNVAPGYEPAPGIRQTHSNEFNSAVTNLGDVNVGHDTSFKNIVIKDELTFTLVPNRTDGMYQFDRRGDNNGFFYLDNRGFGNEWVAQGSANHNFSFTMEMAFDFQFKPDMTFTFTGDDDVWVFIDKNLVLDIGGIHNELSDNFSLNAVLPNAKTGEKHTLRVFYAERHSTASNILIQTNIVAPPSGVGISTQGNDGKGGMVGNTIEKPADTSVTLWSVVTDEAGAVMMPKTPDNPDGYDCNNVTWTINGASVGKGCSIVVSDSIAKTINITVTYTHPGEQPVSKSTGLNVKALPPASIHIQRDSTAKASNSKVLSDDIYFKADEENVRVYAVLRDKYGNFAGYATAKSKGNDNDWWSESGVAQWGSTDKNVATVAPAASASPIVHKEFMGEGTEGDLWVSYRVCWIPAGGTQRCETLTDTVGVGSKSVGQVAIGPNPFKPGTSKVSDTYKDQPKTISFYENVTKVKGDNGVLIAVDAPKPLQPGPGGVVDGVNKTQYGKVMIYDAVGNVVMSEYLYSTQSKPGDTKGAARSYGYVWDGKNMKGRYVGPGTYLVRVSGKDADNNAFNVQRKVGVRK